MKLPLFLLILLILSCKPRYYSLSESERKNIEINPISNSYRNEEKFYSITSKDIPNLINPKEYSLIVFFTSWCPYSRDMLPLLINSTYQKEIALFLITPDDYYFKSNYKKYLQEINYLKPTYFLDIHIYSSWNIHKT